MVEIQLIKKPGATLTAANEVDCEKLRKIKNGTLCLAKIVQPRNPKFHRKFFALLNFGFYYFEPEVQEWNGIKSEKNFEEFRSNVIILAGYRTVTVTIKNEIKVRAKSISFASMDETEFAEVYSKVFNIIWQLVMNKSKIQGFTQELMENTVNSMLRFDK